MDATTLELLNVIQTGIPLVERPYGQIASTLGITEHEVLTRLTGLKSPKPPERPLIRQMSAIFDSKSLGFKTTLVAAKIDESRLDRAAAIINQHPGVSHNYRRNHEFNLWYTLAVPPCSRLGLEGTLEILHERSGAQSTRMLPTLQLYKIGVKFDLSGEGDVSARTESDMQSNTFEARTQPLTEEEKQLVRILQQDLPILLEPFRDWAKEAGMSVPLLLRHAQNFLDQKMMRRFAAVLKHREAGVTANAMGVWDVPESEQEAFGKLASSYNAVSHCYLRKTYPDWPYSIFTMVHASTREQCESILARISSESGVRHYGALYSSTEYKKVRVRYFTPEIGEWESAAIAELGPSIRHPLESMGSGAH